MKKFGIVTAIVVVVICGVAGLALKIKGSAAALTAQQVGADTKVTRGDLDVKVVETGTIDAVKAVELKSLVDGRLAKLFVDEGDAVKKGQLVAIIDPRETQLKVKEDTANLKGASSAADKAKIELDQRRVSAKRDYEQAQLRLAQIKDQLKVQPTLTTDAINQANADLNTATQERDRLKQSILPTEEIASETAKKEAQANYDNALSHFNRQSGLQTKGFVAMKDVEDARLNLDLAQVRLNSANDNYTRIFSQTKLELSKAEEDVRHAQAEVDTANANRFQDVNKKRDYLVAVADVEKFRIALRDVEAMQKGYDQAVAQKEMLQSVLGDSMRNLGETEIKSPVDGIVTKKEIQEGELVASLSSFSSGTGIVRIEDRRSLRVTLAVNEIDTSKLLEGMKARIEVDAIPNKTFEGTVKRIAPASNNIQTTSSGQTATTTDSVVKYQVEIWLTSTDPHLRSGMSAKCTLDTLHKSNALQLPIEYVNKENGKSFVMLPPEKKGGQPQKVYIQTGAETATAIEVLSGLKEGQSVQKPAFNGPARRGFMQGGGD